MTTITTERAEELARKADIGWHVSAPEFSEAIRALAKDRNSRLTFGEHEAEIGSATRAVEKHFTQQLAAAQAENAKLREALEPFAKDRALITSDLPDEADVFIDLLHLSDLRRAAAVLKGEQG